MGPRQLLRMDAEIVGDVEMQAAGELDAILPVRAADAGSVAGRHRRLGVGWRNEL